MTHTRVINMRYNTDQKQISMACSQNILSNFTPQKIRKMDDKMLVFFDSEKPLEKINEISPKKTNKQTVEDESEK